jgi:hypothetical protein
MQMNAELQATALGLGNINYLNAGEAAATVKTVEGQLTRAWDMWALMSRNLGFGARASR